jgi:serine O-acetyltransferase
MDTKVFSLHLWNDHSTHPLALPPKHRVNAFAHNLLGILFPHFSDGVSRGPDDLERRLGKLSADLNTLLQSLTGSLARPVEETASAFLGALPDLYEKLQHDARSIYANDPAAESLDEVIAAYPGFFAIAFYRIAHEFWAQGISVLPRIITEHAHQLTGVDIHPGAVIGTPFFIDHGTGIVIGETAVIGNGVKLYQGVTLGALSVSKEFSHTKRHPTIGDNVIIYSNATILGGNTTIGHDSIIGGNVWLTESVEPFSVVYHKSEINVRNTRSEDGVIDFSI